MLELLLTAIQSKNLLRSQQFTKDGNIRKPHRSCTWNVKKHDNYYSLLVQMIKVWTQSNSLVNEDRRISAWHDCGTHHRPGRMPGQHERSFSPTKSPAKAKMKVDESYSYTSWKLFVSFSVEWECRIAPSRDTRWRDWLCWVAFPYSYLSTALVTMRKFAC